jgi:pyruvate dehydrogenase E2 component (dihydrolipoamide acetyltransferase)
MATEVIMPQLGLTMTEGLVAKWLKAAGEPVKKGEPLLEVETDKLSKEIEATADGVLLRIVIAAGESVSVKTVLAYIGQPGEETNQSLAVAEAAAAAPSVVSQAAVAAKPSPVADGAWIKASPLARRIARENALNLSMVKGTGPDGRIVERDVKAALAAAPTKNSVSPLAAKLAAEYSVDLTSVTKGGRVMSADVLAAIKASESGSVGSAVGGKPLSGMRRVIAERLTQSWKAPHVHMTVEVDMSAAIKLKQQLAIARKEKLSFTELIVLACAQALTEFPTVNSALIDGRLFAHSTVNIGIAVAIDNGLVVPVVRDASIKNLATLRAEIATLSSQARSGNLSPDAMTGGTFTVTNLGMFGVDHFTPVINPPEAAILGVCRVVEKPVVVAGEIVIRPMMNLCLSFDHRIVDGATGAQFLGQIKSLLEEPLLML